MTSTATASTAAPGAARIPKFNPKLFPATGSAGAIAKPLWEMELDIINLGIWLERQGFFQGESKRFTKWLVVAVYIILIQILVMVGLFIEQNNGQK